MVWIELGINEDGNIEVNTSWEDIVGGIYEPGEL